MALPYVPTTFYRGDETTVAESWQEHHQLRWDGWSSIGPPPEPPRTGQHVTFGDLSTILDPLAARLQLLEELVTSGRLSPEALAELIGTGGGGGGSIVSPFSIDADGVPYLNNTAGSANSPISIDTDGVPYLNERAGLPGSGIAIDTDGTPYLIGA